MLFEPDLHYSQSDSERHKQALKAKREKEEAIRKSKKVRLNPFCRRPLGVNEVNFDGRKH